MQAYQYDEFEQPEWVLGRTGAVVQEMEIATTDMRILLILRSFRAASMSASVSSFPCMNQDILIRFKQLRTLDPGWIFHFLWCRCIFTIGEGSAESTWYVTLTLFALWFIKYLSDCTFGLMHVQLWDIVCLL